MPGQSGVLPAPVFDPSAVYGRLATLHADVYNPAVLSAGKTGCMAVVCGVRITSDDGDVFVIGKIGHGQRTSGHLSELDRPDSPVEGLSLT